MIVKWSVAGTLWNGNCFSGKTLRLIAVLLSASLLTLIILLLAWTHASTLPAFIGYYGNVTAKINSIVRPSLCPY